MQFAVGRWEEKESFQLQVSFMKTMGKNVHAGFRNSGAFPATHVILHMDIETQQLAMLPFHHLFVRVLSTPRKAERPIAW